MKYEQILGKKFGLLTILHHQGQGDKMVCRCDCGSEKIARLSHMKSGTVKSCGCLLISRPKQVHGTYLASRTPEYKAWYGMVKRCTDSNHQAYRNYGGRGIYVCERWLGAEGYGNFIADMGSKGKDQSLDRIDNDGPYSPENCRWTSMQVQSNNRRCNLLFEYHGQKKTLADWSRIVGISDNTMRERLKAGWPISDVIGKPLRIKKVSNPS